MNGNRQPLDRFVKFDTRILGSLLLSFVGCTRISRGRKRRQRRCRRCCGDGLFLCRGFVVVVVVGRRPLGRGGWWWKRDTRHHMVGTKAKLRTAPCCFSQRCRGGCVGCCVCHGRVVVVMIIRWRWWYTSTRRQRWRCCVHGSGGGTCACGWCIAVRGRWRGHWCCCSWGHWRG